MSLWECFTCGEAFLERYRDDDAKAKEHMRRCKCYTLHLVIEPSMYMSRKASSTSTYAVDSAEAKEGWWLLRPKRPLLPARQNRKAGADTSQGRR